MARFKKARRSFRRFSKASRRTGSSKLSVMEVAAAGALYGAARPYAANMMPTFFSFGPVDSDNVILGAAGAYAALKGKGLIKALGVIALGTEAGIVTGKFVSGQTVSSTGSNITYYG